MGWDWSLGAFPSFPELSLLFRETVAAESRGRLSYGSSYTFSVTASEQLHATIYTLFSGLFLTDETAIISQAIVKYLK